MIGVRRQIMGQVDAPPIQELPATRQRHQLRGIAVLGHAHAGSVSHPCFPQLKPA